MGIVSESVRRFQCNFLGQFVIMHVVHDQPVKEKIVLTFTFLTPMGYKYSDILEIISYPGRY